jgi:hypothetical protein
MSKKHYIQIAGVLRKTRLELEEGQFPLLAFHNLVEEMEEVLEADNPAFDPERFDAVIFD